jgi:hypothetical protein
MQGSCFLVLSSLCGLCEGFWCLGVLGLRALFCGFFLVAFVWCWVVWVFSFARSRCCPLLIKFYLLIKIPISTIV